MTAVYVMEHSHTQTHTRTHKRLQPPQGIVMVPTDLEHKHTETHDTPSNINHNKGYQSLTKIMMVRHLILKPVVILEA